MFPLSMAETKPKAHRMDNHNANEEKCIGPTKDSYTFRKDITSISEKNMLILDYLPNFRTDVEKKINIRLAKISELSRQT